MIGDMIAKVRKEKNMTKTELAKLTDINIFLNMICIYTKTNNPVIFLPIKYIGTILEVLKRLERYDLLLKIEEF